MASKCISTLAQLRPSSSHNHGIQVDISTLARSRPPSYSPNSHDYGRHFRTFIASEWISPNLLNHGLQVYPQTRSNTASKFARSWPPSESSNPLDHDLEVYLQIHSTTTSKRISKLAWSRPRSVSLISFDCHLQVHLELLSSTACSQSRYIIRRWVAI